MWALSKYDSHDFQDPKRKKMDMLQTGQRGMKGGLGAKAFRSEMFPESVLEGVSIFRRQTRKARLRPCSHPVH